MEQLQQINGGMKQPHSRTQRTSVCLFVGRCNGVEAERTKEVGKGPISHPFDAYLLSTKVWVFSKQ